jgi:hypothetical protein
MSGDLSEGAAAVLAGPRCIIRRLAGTLEPADAGADVHVNLPSLTNSASLPNPACQRAAGDC